VTKAEQAALWLRRAAEIYGDDNDDAAVAAELADLADYVETLDASQPRLIVERNADYGDECDKFHLITNDEQWIDLSLKLLEEYLELLRFVDEDEREIIEANRIVAVQDRSKTPRGAPLAWLYLGAILEYDDDLSVKVERFATT
jgi:hypothetical protein